MERIEGLEGKAKEQKCSFCCHPSGQIRLVLKIILRQLSSILSEKKYADLPVGSQENNGAISRLIRVAFDQQFELKLSKGCSHMRLRNLIKDKLNCRSDQLQIIMEDLCDKVARRHYELEIIASQIKNVENSIIEIEESQPLLTSTKKNSQESDSSVKEGEERKVQRRQSEVEGPGEVKIQEQVEPSPRMVQGSPATGLQYPPSFGQMPYSYNFLFYGSYYQ